ncbi:DUF4259 domain-containing protein [Corynebacterium breve]|uniref:DUF4259 domain-containing protein n=1 Tax=Corynebacterium breve TaxID=3049799 RepID=A0ABY8VKJ2_9CORY|nr:DUF4259 domain-containing protein [Corynebacterium breve]WIM68748.1 DUF4259 domain-containing protein [Corynebacterium breve]
MGTWGVGAFDNDTASELVSELQRGVFRMQQLKFECANGPLTAQQAERVIALGALLAGERPEGVNLEGIDKQLSFRDRRWIAKNMKSAIMPGQSELYALWEDTGELEQWIEETTRVIP